MYVESRRSGLEKEEQQRSNNVKGVRSWVAEFMWSCSSNGQSESPECRWWGPVSNCLDACITFCKDEQSLSVPCDKLKTRVLTHGKIVFHISTSSDFVGKHVQERKTWICQVNFTDMCYSLFIITNPWVFSSWDSTISYDSPRRFRALGANWTTLTLAPSTSCQSLYVNSHPKCLPCSRDLQVWSNDLRFLCLSYFEYCSTAGLHSYRPVSLIDSLINLLLRICTETMGYAWPFSYLICSAGIMTKRCLRKTRLNPASTSLPKKSFIVRFDRSLLFLANLTPAQSGSNWVKLPGSCQANLKLNRIMQHFLGFNIDSALMILIPCSSTTTQASYGPYIPVVSMRFELCWWK